MIDSIHIEPHWQKIGKYPRHGIALHIAGLRSQKSSGIGEFLDLLPIIDWASELNLDCLQILAIHDSGDDPSPYNPMSSIALDPVYISLHDLNIQEDFQKELRLKRVDKASVLDKKRELLFHYFEHTFETTKEYDDFITSHPWLSSYATFKALHEINHFTFWKDWKYIKDPPKNLVQFYLFLQFICFQQMRSVHQYAQKKKILILGDLPALVSEHSADVWAFPSLFHLDIKAGAPPDFFNIHGQNWGFPILNRTEIEKSGYEWWKQRLLYIENFFDCYRIDHVIGLFRIWGIEKEDPPLEGSFYPKNRRLWSQNGKNALTTFLETSRLLPIAEDLGVLSSGMKRVLKLMKIPTTCLIPHMRRKQGFGTYIPFHLYPQESISTLSSHDSPILEAWWIEYPAWAASFARFLKMPYQPLLSSEMKLQILKLSHETPSLFHVNQLQEYLNLFPELSWMNPMEERINQPGTLLPSNWTYRYRPWIEEITQHEGLQKSFASVLPSTTHF